MNLFLIVFLSIIIGGCFSTPAIDVRNMCNLLDEEVRWYKSVKKSEKKYNVPMHVQLAIIYQESHFASHARPPNTKFFGIFPWIRMSSAFGFAQAQNSTWDWYKLKTGHKSAVRSNFDDAVDFVAWYVTQSSKRLKIGKEDTYNQYLAYHEGHNGFSKKTYNSKPWLLKVAKKVSKNAKLYKLQLKKCRLQLDNNKIWSLLG